jgi:hypothetical protein
MPGSSQCIAALAQQIHGTLVGCEPFWLPLLCGPQLHHASDSAGCLIIRIMFQCVLLFLMFQYMHCLATPMCRQDCAALVAAR